MDKRNILESGVWELEKLRDQLTVLEEQKKELANQDIVEEHLENELNIKNNMINQEIMQVINQREQEISHSYDEQIERQNNKVKKVKDKKAKSKSEKVTARIANETESLRESNSKLEEEIKNTFRQGKISRMYNNRFYYALFSPKGLSDFLILLATIMIAFVAVPKLIYIMMSPSNAILFYVITYLLIILIVGGLYYIAYHATKLKNHDVIEKGRELKFQVRQNNAQIKKIKRKIMKDKDETVYNLDSYNEEIHKLEEKIRDITREKNEALATLKNTTSNILANEVRAKYEMEVSEITKQSEEQKEKTRQIEEQIRERTADITNNYQAYLGSDLMNVAAVDTLINIMNANDLRAITEGLQIYHNQAVPEQTTSIQK